MAEVCRLRGLYDRVIEKQAADSSLLVDIPGTILCDGDEGA